MPRILREGQEAFTVTCKRCLCIFKYALDECTEKGHSEYVTCPWCNAEVLHAPLKGANYEDASQT